LLDRYLGAGAQGIAALGGGEVFPARFSLTRAFFRSFPGGSCAPFLGASEGAGLFTGESRIGSNRLFFETAM